MSVPQKISPAFEAFLAEGGPSDKRNAIVIYEAPPQQASRLRGRLRTLQQRLDHVKCLAASQEPVGKKVLKEYQEVTRGSSSSCENLAVAAIGSNNLPMASVEVTRSSLDALEANPEVVAVLPDQRIHLIAPREVDCVRLAKSEQKAGLTWGLQELRVSELWKTTKGTDINVAVLDTGVFGDHPALTGRVRDFVVIDPLGRRITSSMAFDCGQHGTHVCGTIAGARTPEGVSIGVAPDAKLLVAAVLLGNATLRTLLEGISWAVERGADIINMSLGFTYYEPLFAKVFDILMQQYGVLPVVAIGNENHGNSSSPGNAPGALSAGAVEKIGRRKLDVAFFSSGASLVFPGEEPNALVTKPDVVAPGVQIYSCVPPENRPEGTFEYAYMDGTSMAAPHVAGAAALLMGAKPDVPATRIMEVLKETARHPQGASARPDNRWGYGIIQPVEALKALG